MTIKYYICIAIKVYWALKINLQMPEEKDFYFITRDVC